MNHQVNSGSLHPELKSRKGAGSKKKNKKAKEMFEGSKSDVDKCSEVDNLGEALREKLSLSSKAELTNGICSVHSVHINQLGNGENVDSSVYNPKRSNGEDQPNEDSDKTQAKASVSETESPKSEQIAHANTSSILEDLNKLEAALDARPTTYDEDIEYLSYESELQMAEIMRLIQKDLSEPYSIYTYRYFIHNWPKLCFLAMSGGRCIGAIVCKLDLHRKVVKRGYIAMLAVDEKFRKRKIGSRLVRQAIQMMIQDDADEVVLETEITNKPALRLYENLGFVRDKRLFRYYLNGVDALRLKLWLR